MRRGMSHNTAHPGVPSTPRDTWEYLHRIQRLFTGTGRSGSILFTCDMMMSLTSFMSISKCWMPNGTLVCTRRDGPKSWGSGEESRKTTKRYVERKILTIRLHQLTIPLRQIRGSYKSADNRPVPPPIPLASLPAFELKQTTTTTTATRKSPNETKAMHVHYKSLHLFCAYLEKREPRRLIFRIFS